jgi:hypothetical protein
VRLLEQPLALTRLLGQVLEQLQLPQREPVQVTAQERVSVMQL